MNNIFENIKWTPKWRIIKYSSQEAKNKEVILEIKEIDGNILCNEGINEILKTISSSEGTKYDNTNAYLIVGTGETSAQATDTEGTFTAGVKQGMVEGYPQAGSDQKITWKASYDGTTANQDWKEFGVLNAETSGKLLNRKVDNQGTKIEGQVWELELEITLS